MDNATDEEKADLKDEIKKLQKEVDFGADAKNALLKQTYVLL